MGRRPKRRMGGQLNRSETVTVRLDPKLNYLCELAARSQRRTKSSLIEAALADALNVVPIDSRPSETPPTPIAQLAEALWHVDEVERLCRLVALAPHLMTYEEQKIWSTICDNSYFWFGEWQSLDEETDYYTYKRLPQNVWTCRVQEHWGAIKQVALESADKSVLPEGLVVRPKKGKPLNALASYRPKSSN